MPSRLRRESSAGEGIDGMRALNERYCYSAPDVLKLELAGGVAIQGILAAMVDAVKEPRTTLSNTLRRLLPQPQAEVLNYEKLNENSRARSWNDGPFCNWPLP